jgi:hypothetical protein
MSSDEKSLGNGIVKQSARPVKVFVGSDGEYWLCDAGVNPAGDFGSQGCLAHSAVQMAEGG